MFEILIGLVIGFLGGSILIFSDHKGKVAAGYIPYIGKDGTLMWREAPNNASTGQVATDGNPSEG